MALTPQEIAATQYFDEDAYVEAKAQMMYRNGKTGSVEDAKAQFLSKWTGDMIDHYLQYGAAENVNPSNNFDNSNYIQQVAVAEGLTYQEVKADLESQGMTPLAHFLDIGEDLGYTAPVVPEDEQVVVDTPVVEGETFTLTAGTDSGADFEGGDGDDIYDAPIVQNAFAGGVSNSLSSAADLDGGAGTDTLNAVLVSEFVGATTGYNIDVQPTTTSIEDINIEALDYSYNGVVADPDAGLQNTVTLDAKNMTGIDEIGSYMSDGDLVIENLTTLDDAGNARNTEAITITMDHTDNFNSDGDASDLTVYFDEDYLLSGQTTSGSSLIIRILNAVNNANSENPIEGTTAIEFSVGSDQVTVDITSIASDTTLDYTTAYDEVVDAINAQLIADGFTDVVATKATIENAFFSIPVANFSAGDDAGDYYPIVVTNSGSEELYEGVFTTSQLEYDTEQNNSMQPNLAETTDNPVTVNVELEKVGRDGDGGNLLIGGKDQGLNGDGIPVFKITVNGDEDQPSYLGNVSSTNNALREIYVTTDADQTETYAGLSIGNITDVQIFDAANFKGDLTLTSNLTNGIMDKYLDLTDDAADYSADNANFVYTGGVGDDTITLNIDGMPVAHEDFTLSVDSGAGDDTITTQVGFFNDNVVFEGDDQWEYGDHKALDNLSIETGEGDDVVNTIGDGDFFISTGSGDDTVYTNNDGLGFGDALVQEVQTITFDEAGDLDSPGNVTVTLSDGTSFTTTTIKTDDDAITVAQKVTAEINGQNGGVDVVAVQNGSQVELTYTAAYINAQSASNGDVANATVRGIVTDVTMNAAVITTPAVPGTSAAEATTERVVINSSAIADGSAGDTLTIDGTVITLADTDGNGTVTPFEITEQIANTEFANYTITDSNPSIATVNLTANTAGNVADLAAAGTGVSAPAIGISQGVDAVDYVAGTAEVQTLTITNGADQAGTVILNIDLDADGVNEASEVVYIDVSYGNQADVAADIAAGINALSGVSATHAANSDDIVVTWDSDLRDPAAITMIDGAVRNATVAEVTKGRVASSNDATWVLNAENTEIDDLSGRDASADSILYNAKVTVTLSGATFGSSGDDVTNGAASATNNGFEASATIPTSEYLGNEYEVNQAIKDAIQNDSVMNMLLSVEDGPEDTLIITSKVDGKVLTSDLAIDITGPSSLTANELSSLNAAYQDLMNNSTLSLSETEMLAVIRANAAAMDTVYGNLVLGTDEGVELAGHTSTSESDNVINLGSGDDLVVLGTDAQSNDTIQFTGSDIGKNAIFNFVADGASDSTDYLDLSAYLTNTASISGSTLSETAIAGDYLFNANTLNENDVVFINDFASAAGQSWAGLTGDSLKTALINTNNSDYGSIDDTDLDVSNANTNLVGSEIKNIIFVENDANDGEYKVFEATSSKTADEFTSITLLGEVDFGNTITTMSQDAGLDNDGTQDNIVDPAPVAAPVNNFAPVAVDNLAAFNIAQSGTTIFNDLLDGLATEAGDDLIIINVDDVVGGTAEISKSGTSITFTADADFTGEASFTYEVFDGKFSDTATIAGTVVDDGNTAPVADDDTFTVTVSEAADLDVLDNDDDADGDTVALDNSAAIVVDGPDGATATAEYDMDNNDINFTADTAGTYTFDYAVTDGNGGTDTASVEVTVQAESTMTAQSIDIGTAITAEAVDASTDSFKFTDDAAVLNNVVISDFTNDDVIQVTGALETDYSFSNNGADVEVSYNNAGTLNKIVLTGVVTADDLIYDQASFEAAIGFDAFTVA